MSTCVDPVTGRSDPNCELCRGVNRAERREHLSVSQPNLLPKPQRRSEIKRRRKQGRQRRRLGR